MPNRPRQDWLGEAVQQWSFGDKERAINALNRSIQLKRMPLALHFRDFIIQQQSAALLTLLAANRKESVLRLLYPLRGSLPYSATLQALKDFADYLQYAGKNTDYRSSASTDV